MDHRRPNTREPKLKKQATAAATRDHPRVTAVNPEESDMLVGTNGASSQTVGLLRAAVMGVKRGADWTESDCTAPQCQLLNGAAAFSAGVCSEAVAIAPTSLFMEHDAGVEEGLAGASGGVAGSELSMECDEQAEGCSTEQQQGCQHRNPNGRATQSIALTGTQGICPEDMSPHGVSNIQSAISRQELETAEFFLYGAHLGNETRHLEFKRGGGEYLRSALRAHLRRYACAFLNSGGGILLVGVDDAGVVQGLCCDHQQEDRARLLVDSILKGFHPPLLPQNYSLSFVPVVRPGPEGCRLKVLRLSLHPVPGLSQPPLYQTDQGEVYLRRDASVEGPLSAASIQEWARQKWCGEVAHMRQCLEQLRAEQKMLLQEMRQQGLAIAALQQPSTHSHIDPHTHPYTHPQTYSNTPSPHSTDRQTCGQGRSHCPLMQCHAQFSSASFEGAEPGPTHAHPAPVLDRDVPNGLSQVKDPSMPRQSSHAGCVDMCPRPLQFPQGVSGQRQDVNVSRACVIM